MCLFECVAILMPPLVPEPTGNNRHQIGPIRYPDDQFLLHCSILFDMACAVLLHPVCQHGYRDPLAATKRAAATDAVSNVVWAQGGDHLGGPPMDFGFPLEILWEPATPRLDQRLLRLGLMPSARSRKSSIPPLLELWGDLCDRIGHRWFLLL